MKISRIEVRNFRLLRDLKLDVEKELSLLIGKNNSGKTSLLSILDKFIGIKSNNNLFSYDDFNIDFQRDIKNLVEGEGNVEEPCLGISMYLFIEYDHSDNLANISKLMLDLNPNNNTIVLKFEYSMLYDDLLRLRTEFREYKQKQKINKRKEKSINDYLKSFHKKYFKIYKKSVGFDWQTQREVDSNYIDLMRENISLDKVLKFKFISAKRNVTNSDTDKTLSALSSKYYEKNEDKGTESEQIALFKEALSETDTHLDTIYDGLFGKVIKKVEKFGGVNKGDSVIKITSTLQERELLKGNTTVMYDHNNEYALPENYNGLGYLNLISMIFEIEILLSEFRMDTSTNVAPSDINLLFIEEPEAHTHPQMQYIFIRNIKAILLEASSGKDGVRFNLQTIITTHSSHITAESKFKDIKYFYKNENQVCSKNLKDLEVEYVKDDELKNFKFLKQYLTLHRSELFFVDKVIFIEGDTERILLPAMMKKIDQECKENPMLSQNISIIEVGAFSHIFEKFIEFIGVKSLIITDIDSANENQEKCRVMDSEASKTTNYSLKYFYKATYEYYAEGFTNQVDVAKETKNPNARNMKELSFYLGLDIQKKLLGKNRESKKWVQNDKGHVLVTYQTPEVDSKGEKYHARSFEDCFFHLNRQFVIDKIKSFKSLKNINYFKDSNNDPYFLAEECIDKKPNFVMEILWNSEEENGNEFINWEIPSYIKEGLLWLKNS